MQKKSSICIILLILIFSIIPAQPVYAVEAATASTGASAAEVGVSINDQSVIFSQNSGQPFVDQASRTQVPFRATMESFGCNVRWDSDHQTAIAEKSGTVVEVPVGRPYIIKNGEQISSDTAALIKDGRTYLPIRAVLEAFGASVTWDSNTQTVLVATVPMGPLESAPTTSESAASLWDASEGELTVHFLDVGQADSIFIDFGSYEILVDGGNNADGPLVVNYIRQYVDDDLDLMVATHAHEDHIGGLDNVLSAYQVDRIIFSGETSSTASFQSFYTAAAAEPNCTLSDDSDMTIDMGPGAAFQILEMGDDYGDPNENSVVSMVDYNDIEVLLTGDLESTVEKTNLSKFSDIDVLKVGHHGSRTASSQAFLDVIRPEASVISAGLDNSYSLPNPDIISRLLAMNSSVYGTFRSGTSIMATDGTQYHFSTDTLLTVNDGGALSSSLPGSSQSTGAVQSQTSGMVTESEAAYIGNASTMKLHTLDCSAGSKIADRNVVYFKDRAAAVQQGYIPCKLCNP